MPRAPRFKQSTSTRTSPLHSINLPQPTANGPPVVALPRVLPKLTLASLPAGCVINGRLTTTAMNYVQTVYMIRLTEAQRALTTVDNIKNPERLNRRKKSKSRKKEERSPEGEGAAQVKKVTNNNLYRWCFVCDNDGHRFERVWKHEVSDFHRENLADALRISVDAIPALERIPCAADGCRIAYRRRDQLIKHQREKHGIEASDTNEGASKGSARENTSVAPVEPETPRPEVSVPSVSSIEIRQQLEPLDTLARSSSASAPNSPTQVLDASYSVSQVPTTSSDSAPSAIYPSEESYHHASSSLAFDPGFVRSSPRSSPRLQDAEQLRVAEDELVALDATIVEPRPESSEDLKLLDPWNAGFPDDHPSLAADVLFDRFCVWPHLDEELTCIDAPPSSGKTDDELLNF